MALPGNRSSSDMDIVPFPDSTKLVKAGFVYNKQGDSVSCAFCGIQLGRLKEGDDPMVNHQLFSPNCLYVKHKNLENVPFGQEGGQSNSTFSVPENALAFIGHKKTNDSAPTDKQSNYKSEQKRKTTYTNCNLQVPVEKLVEAGFYYTGQGDLVCCAFCKIEIGRWKEGTDPMKIHLQWAPFCPYVCNKLPSLSTTIRSASGPEYGPRQGRPLEEKHGIHKATGPRYMDYFTYDVRLQSFLPWPVSLKQNPKVLSEAGFFYNGTGDQTVCFYCGGRLSHWEDSDDPWEEHAFFFPNCKFVLSNKGEQFIDKVRADKQAHLPREEVQELGSSGHPGSSTAGTSQEKMGDGEIDHAHVCKICFIEEQGAVFLPCSHMAACVQCAACFSECPICRRPIEKTKRVYPA